MNTQELFEKMDALYNLFKLEHSEKSKAAHNRARKKLGEFKNLIPEYRKASIIEDKAK
jgi:hypothetical protein